MTEEEKLDNDWRFDSRPNKDDLRAKGQHPRNPLRLFQLPLFVTMYRFRGMSICKKLQSWITEQKSIVDAGMEL